MTSCGSSPPACRVSRSVLTDPLEVALPPHEPHQAHDGAAVWEPWSPNKPRSTEHSLQRASISVARLAYKTLSLTRYDQRCETSVCKKQSLRQLSVTFVLCVCGACVRVERISARARILCVWVFASCVRDWLTTSMGQNEDLYFISVLFFVSSSVIHSVSTRSAGIADTHIDASTSFCPTAEPPVRGSGC